MVVLKKCLRGRRRASNSIKTTNSGSVIKAVGREGGEIDERMYGKRISV